MTKVSITIPPEMVKEMGGAEAIHEMAERLQRASAPDKAAFVKALRARIKAREKKE